MKSILKSLPFIMVAGIAMHPACDNGEDSTTSGATVTVSTGAQNADLCEGGFPDEFCNALGDNPESCECFDCVNTSKCKQLCTDDGQCAGNEDCSCIDCYNVLGPQCEPVDPTTDATTDATTDTTAGTGGAATTGSTTATTNGAGGAATTAGAGGAGGN
jgi:hypothetical protein